MYHYRLYLSTWMYFSKSIVRRIGLLTVFWLLTKQFQTSFSTTTLKSICCWRGITPPCYRLFSSVKFAKNQMINSQLINFLNVYHLYDVYLFTVCIDAVLSYFITKPKNSLLSIISSWWNLAILEPQCTYLLTKIIRLVNGVHFLLAPLLAFDVQGQN